MSFVTRPPSDWAIRSRGSVERIGRADRVFIVLSDKYLKSPYCMFELFEIWRNNRADSALFAERIRAFTLPSTRIATFTDRNPYASYWDEKKQGDWKT